MNKKVLLPIMALFISASVFASGNEGTEIAEPNSIANVESQSVLSSSNISVTLGSGNTLFTQHTSRNNCTASYWGSREVDHFSWGGNWSVDYNSPHSDNYSSVYLRANSSSLSSPSTVQVTVFFVDGGSESALFSVTTVNDW